MTTKGAMFVFIVGLLMTMGAVVTGMSLPDTDLMSSMVVAIVGLLTMLCGVLGLNRAHMFD